MNITNKDNTFSNHSLSLSFRVEISHLSLKCRDLNGSNCFQVYLRHASDIGFSINKLYIFRRVTREYQLILQVSAAIHEMFSYISNKHFNSTGGPRANHFNTRARELGWLRVDACSLQNVDHISDIHLWNENLPTCGLKKTTELIYCWSWDILWLTVPRASLLNTWKGASYLLPS